MANEFNSTDVIGLAVDYLNKKYKTSISTEYYTNIRTWRLWWEGYVKEVHSYRELGVDGSARMRELYRLGMAKRITEDWASLLLNEKTQIVIDDKGNIEGRILLDELSVLIEHLVGCEYHAKLTKGKSIEGNIDHFTLHRNRTTGMHSLRDLHFISTHGL